MSHKESGSHFKRMLTGSGGNAGAQGHLNFSNTGAKKSTKLRTSAPEPIAAKQGNNYMLHPDHEPLLGNMLSTSPADIPGNGKLGQKLTPHYESPCGHLSPSDFRYDSSRGVMSVTDIDVTMGDDDPHDHVHPPGSPLGSLISANSATSNTNSRACAVTRCNKILCDENSCLWHRCVLKLPQHVRWEDRIVTVELQRNEGESFGFSHKTKQHVGRDEIYTLVSRIDEYSKAARNGLAVGDLILSANGIPMQTKQKLTEINFKTQTKLRLQIQHPLEISDKASNHVEQLMISMGKINESSIRFPQPPTPSTSPDTNLPATKGSIQLLALPKQEPKPKTVSHKLPQVRMFICGNAASDFIHCLIGNFINVSHEDKARYFEISMKMCADGSVTISNSESFSYLFEDPSESCINVELVAVSDDSFFHHCCSWMFTPNSVFILTFDTKRLSMSSETEMSRLCSLAHTVQTGTCGGFRNIKVCGITPMDDSIYPEEVQTLFYTSLGKSLPKPEIIPLVKGSSCPEMKHLRQDVFSLLARIRENQQITYPAAIVLDHLVSYRGLTTTQSELARPLENSNLETKQVGPESLHRVIEDLINSGNLLVTGSFNAACISENVKEFVLPCMLFDQLSYLTQCTEKERIPIRQQDTWSTLNTDGIVTRNDFLEILNVCTSDPHKLLSCMEDLHLVFPVKVLSQDSGFGDNDNVLFPYFLQEVSFSYDQNHYEIYATVEFSEDVPASCFYSMLSELSQSNRCQSIKMRAQFIGHMILEEEDIYLYFVKTGKQMQIFRNRLRAFTVEGKQSTLQQIQQVIGQQLPSHIKLRLNIYTEEKRASGANDTKDPFVDGNGFQPDEKLVIRMEEEAACSLPCSPDGASHLAGPIPMDLIARMNDSHDIDESIGAAAAQVVPQGNELSEEEDAKEKVLMMNMVDLKYIHRPLHELYGYLSVGEALKELSGACGLTLAEWHMYDAVVKNQPNRLPAQTFLETYFKEKHITLRDFTQILLRLAEHDHNVVKALMTNLWVAALRGNSQYFKDLCQNL